MGAVVALETLKNKKKNKKKTTGFQLFSVPKLLNGAPPVWLFEKRSKTSKNGLAVTRPKNFAQHSLCPEIHVHP